MHTSAKVNLPVFTYIVSFRIHMSELSHLRAFIRELLGVNHLEEIINRNHEEIMAAFLKVMEGIQTNGILIGQTADALAVEMIEVKNAIQDAKDGIATQAQLDEALAKITANNAALAQIKDTASQLVPSLPSPEVPTPPVTDESPVPTPTPEPIPFPESPDEIDVVESPEVGIDGSIAIDVI
jgi:hypothetical protein